MADGHTKLHQSEHASGGVDEIGQGSLLPQDPTSHASEHLSGGSDELTGIDAGQLASGVLNNTELEMLDGVNTSSSIVTKDQLDAYSQGIDWQESVMDKDVSDPSTLTPSEGDRYIVPSSPSTGTAWEGHGDEVAEYNGSGWDFMGPDEGYAVWVEDEDVQYNYNGTSWVKFGSSMDHGAMSGLGDDDHTIYLLADGGRNLQGNLVPDGQGTRALGESGTEFSNVYTQGVQSSGTLTVSGSPLELDTPNLTGPMDCGGYALSSVGDITSTGVVDISGGEFHPKVVSQSAEPSLSTGEAVIWEDSDNTDVWLVQNIGGTQYKVQLT